MCDSHSCSRGIVELDKDSGMPEAAGHPSDDHRAGTHTKG